MKLSPETYYLTTELMFSLLGWWKSLFHSTYVSCAPIVGEPWLCSAWASGLALHRDPHWADAMYSHVHPRPSLWPRCLIICQHGGPGLRWRTWHWPSRGTPASGFWFTYHRLLGTSTDIVSLVLFCPCHLAATVWVSQEVSEGKQLIMVWP